MTPFDNAYRLVSQLAHDFRAHEQRYLSADYQEAEARKDFIDKFWKALGWDVDHEIQKNPYEQEVKVERGQQQGAGRKRADYAFFLAPNFRDVRFFVEAKKPSRDFGSPDQYFQTICYGWGNKTAPFSALTSFDDFHILDCRYKPNINDTLSRVVERFSYADYINKEKFSRIYWLFSREAVASGSLEKFAAIRPKPKSKAFRRGLFKGGDISLDDDFLEELDDYRQKMALAFKKKNPELTSELLTEVTQRTLDRLVFTRFLEDKIIEPPQVENFGKHDGVWEDFISSSLRLDRKYNGIVYKQHPKLDAPGFQPEGQVFARICEELSDPTSPYNFNTIPIHILGSIYERFLGKVISDSARVVEKPEVRKAGGVYYTPEYIVRYIVDNTVGKLIEGKNPAQISEMRFADIACGSGSFLLGVFDSLLRYHTKFFNENPAKAKKGDYVKREDGLHLSLQKKQSILRNNLYGVDIDRQAVEVAQLSLYLKLLEDETIGSTNEFQTEFHYTLLPSLEKNIICGNSLIGPDIFANSKFSPEEEKKLNPMDFDRRFPEIMRGGGFDVIAGNPPYALIGADQPRQQDYFTSGRFKLTAYKINLYLLFLERALGLLRKGTGCLGYIIPKSLAFNTYFASARAQILQNFTIPLLVEIRDKVFAEGEVGDSLLFFAQATETPLENVLCYRVVKNVFPTETLIEEFKQRNSELLSSEGAYFRPNKWTLRVKTVPLASRWQVSNGLNPGNVRHLLFAATKETPKHRKLLLGRDLQRYQLTWSGTWVNFDASLKSKLKASDIKSKQGMTAQTKVDFALRSREIYERAKIMVRKTADHIIACFDDKDFCFDSLSYGIRPRAETKESPFFLLGLLNSTLLDRIHGGLSQNKEKVFAKVLAENLNKLPLPVLDLSKIGDKARHDKLVALVEEMQAAKKQLSLAQSDADKDFYENKCAALDRQIDELAYELYGLTEDEIKIVEGAAK